ncbi:hypothetical protein JCM10908_003584 [Rhodotorula pacifica]|uniref:uncharacterized protein n=1 Tax=Rhodotorula pacifica TaxID=1495444 RepID=UPI00317797DB
MERSSGLKSGHWLTTELDGKIHQFIGPSGNTYAAYIYQHDAGAVVPAQNARWAFVVWEVQFWRAPGGVPATSEAPFFCIKLRYELVIQPEDPAELVPQQRSLAHHVSRHAVLRASRPQHEW